MSRKPSSGKQRTFKFTGMGEGNGKDKTHSLLSAKLNVQIKYRTPEGAMRKFQKIHGNSDHEFGAVIDGQGFVHKYVEGDTSSVSISSNNPNHLVLHNHPSGGAFSRADMLAFSHDKAKGLVASGSKYDYVITKTSHWDKYSQAFEHAIKTAKIQGKDYDDAVHRWLRANQRKYHYKYYRKKN